MKVPFTWKPTGWFMVGWSGEFVTGTVTPLKYLGHDMVAWRGESGEMHVLDAHCPHLGAHMGHGGKVNGECVECPYHGWGYGPDGVNKYIPYEDRPNVSKSVRTWPVKEMHEAVYIWHDPAGGPPRWDLPNVFEAWPGMDHGPEHYYRAYPELSVKYTGEPVHPQVPLENAADSMHFKYVHDATVSPLLLHYAADGPEFRGTVGWPNPKRPESGEMALKVHTLSNGVGNTLNVFEGSAAYRLIFCVTPVDDETSDMFYSIWWPRGDDASETVPEEIRRRVEQQFLVTLVDDLEILRYQVYVEHPALAQIDAKPYGALRKWARQFYEIPVGA
jgi:3-ketosteroid 9alpha-monooxygenase subunit A